MYNICVFRHSKIVMFLAHIIGYFFSLYICPCMTCSKRKYAKKFKSKKNKNAFNYGCKHVSRRCGSYTMYFEGDSPHQIVMIMCKCIWFSHILDCHNMRNLCNLAMVFTHNMKKNFVTFDTCVGTMWFGHHKGYMC